MQCNDHVFNIIAALVHGSNLIIRSSKNALIILEVDFNYRVLGPFFIVPIKVTLPVELTSARMTELVA
ncbi:hypothetical protein SDC49_05830 [Lactobacillus sp. R2/2]|nr:hypothetical protein [Lactobacillus sp. R2/2]